MKHLLILCCLLTFVVGCPKKGGDDEPPTEQPPAELAKDATCETDDDCDLSTLQADSSAQDYCCDTCIDTAANKTYLGKLDAACSKHRESNADECPSLRCSETNLVAKCVDKTCTAVEKEEEKADEKAAFPERDDSCKTDDDCTMSSAGWKGDYCCSKCGSEAYSTAWLAEVKKVCDAQMGDKDYHDRCPQLSCTQQPERVAKCVEEKCTSELKK